MDENKSSGQDNKPPTDTQRHPQTTTVISREIAEKDMNKFLDAKRYGATKRENYRDNIDILIDAIQDGQLLVNEDCSLTQKLLFPPSENSPIRELKYKPRIGFSQVQPKLKGIKPGDTESKLIAYASALTDQPVGVLRPLDTNDMAVLQSIAVFFL